MKTLRTLFSALCLLCLSVAASAQTTRAATYPAKVGPVDIQLPVPAGFREVTATAPKLREFGENFTPKGNRLLAFFISESDLAQYANGDAPQMKRYFMVQTLRAMERDVISAQGMAEIKDVLRKQHKSLFAQVQKNSESELAAASKRLGDQVGKPDLDMKVGELHPLEVFGERDNSISLSALTKFNVNTNAVSREVPIVMAITTLTVRGKIVYFYAYSVHDEPSDIDWVRAVTLEWLSALP